MSRTPSAFSPDHPKIPVSRKEAGALARRLQKNAARGGVKLKYTQALSELAGELGYGNVHELAATLDRPLKRDIPAAEAYIRTSARLRGIEGDLIGNSLKLLSHFYYIPDPEYSPQETPISSFTFITDAKVCKGDIDATHLLRLEGYAANLLKLPHPADLFQPGFADELPARAELLVMLARATPPYFNKLEDAVAALDVFHRLPDFVEKPFPGLDEIRKDSCRKLCLAALDRGWTSAILGTPALAAVWRRPPAPAAESTAGDHLAQNEEE
jgi:hypothetical protein